ncbi:hypothetical protein BIV25_16650 [Streptomyces sp. MUSC 14]|nr:hypothetical protein BIV25_16650 [Streptomyces sp. MUSC 14]
MGPGCCTWKYARDSTRCRTVRLRSITWYSDRRNTPPSRPYSANRRSWRSWRARERRTDSSRCPWNASPARCSRSGPPPAAGASSTSGARVTASMIAWLTP